MAGDWIKMRMDLADDPAVYRISALTKLDRLSVVGRLYAFWAWADKHAVDGCVDGATSTVVDDVVRLDGFSSAMVSVRWLEVGEDYIAIPNHDRHNGESAKERCLKNQRQSRWREGKKKEYVDVNSSTSPSTSPSTDASTREEKRREDKENNKGDEYAADFLLFWKSWPTGFGQKGNKWEAFSEWRKAKIKPDAEALIAAARSQADEKAAIKRNGNFAADFPHVCRWLKKRGWETEVESVARRVAL